MLSLQVLYTCCRYLSSLYTLSLRVIPTCCRSPPCLPNCDVRLNSGPLYPPLPSRLYVAHCRMHCRHCRDSCYRHALQLLPPPLNARSGRCYLQILISAAASSGPSCPSTSSSRPQYRPPPLSLYLRHGSCHLSIFLHCYDSPSSHMNRSYCHEPYSPFRCHLLLLPHWDYFHVVVRCSPLSVPDPCIFFLSFFSRIGNNGCMGFRRLLPHSTCFCFCFVVLFPSVASRLFLLFFQ